MRQKILNVLAILLGLWMLNSGLNKFFQYMPMPEEMPEAIVNANSVLMQLEWLNPLVAVVEIIGGVLFAMPKYRALGSMILIPVFVGILLFHLFTVPMTVIVPLLMFLIIIWAVIEDWEKYLPMIAEG